MTIFEWILFACIGVVALCMLVGMYMIIKIDDMCSRAVLSDLIFYSMVTLYLIWTIPNETFIGYEVAILAALVGGVMPTLSMSRIISRGRR